jgi:hypothetical protein
MGLFLYIPEENFFECVPAPLNIRRVTVFNDILRNTIRNILDANTGNKNGGAALNGHFQRTI